MRSIPPPFVSIIHYIGRTEPLVKIEVPHRPFGCTLKIVENRFFNASTIVCQTNGGPPFYIDICGNTCQATCPISIAARESPILIPESLP